MKGQLMCEFPGCKIATTRSYCKTHRVWIGYLKRPISRVLPLVLFSAILLAGCSSARLQRHLEQSDLVTRSVFPELRERLEADTAITDSERQPYLTSRS